MKEELIVKKLIDNKETISSMESCTAGYFATTITNVSGSSEVLLYSAITYSNEFKIKMGVPKEIIDKYTVFSIETSASMAKEITKFSSSTYGVGITGQIGRIDPSNNTGNVNEIFVTIYNSKNDKCHSFKINTKEETRLENKKYIVNKILDELLNIL
jgi:PncC family amidohydrolase